MIQLFVIVKTTGCYFIQSYCIELLAQLLQFCTCLYVSKGGGYAYVCNVCLCTRTVNLFLYGSNKIFI